MGEPAAKEGDKVIAVDIHIILNQTPVGPVPTPTPCPFDGIINGSLSENVKIMGLPAAMQGSTAQNMPPHIPEGDGSFAEPPSNKAEIIIGSLTVMINGKPAARNGDRALTCNDPVDLPVGTVVAVGTVLVG